mmetsp:Transcript_120794/g.188646  ORF Transcript_120794/g.188646 Transcript_120794/m.188646 type:complete len:247 (-) Transcript_120794:192-932(-)
MICPLGHALQAFTTAEPGWTCSVCAQVLDVKCTLMGCRPCDFDVCEQCSVHDFDGCWITSAGQSVDITGPCIKGSLSLFRSERAGHCSMEINSVRYYGQLCNPNRIEWDDGDVWTRGEPLGPRYAGTAAEEIVEPNAILRNDDGIPPQPTPEDGRPPANQGRGLALPRAPPAADEVQPPLMPAPILPERHEVSPQWAVVVEEETRNPIAATAGSGLPKAPPPPPPPPPAPRTCGRPSRDLAAPDRV